MTKKDWIRISRYAQGCSEGIGLLKDPAYEIKSQMWIGYHPDDVKRGEEELIFTGERKAAMETQFDTWAALIDITKRYMDRCKKYRKTSQQLQDMDEAARARVVESLENANADIDMEMFTTPSGEESDKMTGDACLVMVLSTQMVLSEDISQHRGSTKRKRSSGTLNRVQITATLLAKREREIVHLAEGGTRELQPPTFVFNSAVAMLMRENQKRGEPAPRNKKFANEIKKPKTVVESALQLESDREMRCDSIVTLDHWCDIGRAIVNQQDCEWLHDWDTAEARKIMRGGYVDRMDPFLGPWSDCLKGTAFEFTRAEDFYSFMLEMSRRSSDKCAHSIPKYPKQLLDTTYLRDHICNADEDLPTDPDQIRTILLGKMEGIHESHPELLGITFDHLPSEVIGTCIFNVDLGNVDGRRWLLQRPPISDWYENIQQFETTTQLAHSEAIVAPSSGLHVPYMPSGTQMLDNALTESAILYRPRPKASDNKDVIISNMRTPFHETAEEMDSLSQFHTSLLADIRSGSEPCPEQCSKLRPHYQLIRLKMKRLLNLQYDPDMPTGTQNVCAYITDTHSGFFGEKKNLVRRVFHRSMAPDMESGCNAMAMSHIMLEQLGCSSMHSTCYLSYLAALQTMASKMGLGINPVLHGVGGAGKTHAISLVMKLMLISGTMIIEGYSSRLAMLGAQKVILDTVIVVDEGLDYVIKSEFGPSNVGPQESTLKLRLSESVISAKTLTHQDGKKITITQELLAIGAMIFLTNAGSLPRSLGEALLSRLMDIEVPRQDRKHKGLVDKMAAGTMNTEVDDVTSNISSHFKHIQAFAWLYGKATTFLGIMDVDMSAFGIVCKQYENALISLGVKLTARDIQKAAMIAKERTKEAVYYSEFSMPHGRMTGYTDVDIDRFFDPQHSIEMAMVCSEAIANSSMRMVLTKYHRGTMCQVANAIVSLANQSIHKYSTLFTQPTSIKDSVVYGEENCIVDLNYVRFTVKRDANGVRQFAGWVAGALAETSGNSITPDQVLDVLDEIEKLGEIEHNELDMLLDLRGSTAISANELMSNHTVSSWKKKHANGPCNFDPKWLDDTKKLHNETGNKSLRYWPHESIGADARKVNTRALVMDDARFTGQIKISTAFLNNAKRPEFARDFESSLTNALSTSYTTERIIAKQPTDIMSANPEFPYLVPTERAMHSSHQISVTNQQFISKAHYGVTELGERSEYRRNEIIHPINAVPLDTQAVVSRADRMSKKHPTVLPSAHQLLKADPSGISARFAPYVLDCMLRKKSAFNEKEVVRYLQLEYMDLMRHQLDKINIQTTPSAQIECNEFTLKIAHVIVEMSAAKRMGDLRRRAIVSENNAVNGTEIKMAKKVRKACVKANGDLFKCKHTGDTKYNDMLERLRYSELSDIDLHIANLEKRNSQNNKNEKIAMEHSGTNDKFHTFIDEWRSIKKHGAHGGDKYIHYLRSNGTRLLRERHERENKWMGLVDGEYWTL